MATPLMRLRSALVGIAILTGIACSDSSGPEGLCTTAAVDISIGDEVVFSWSDCALTALSVTDAFGRTIWSIEGTFRSPVTYGVVPPGAEQSAPGEALEAGRTYTVASASGSVVVFDSFVR